MDFYEETVAEKQYHSSAQPPNVGLPEQEQEIDSATGGLLGTEEVYGLSSQRPVYQAVKRGQDVILSLAALLLLSPLLLAIALVIWLDDPHASPIFSQIRCGKDGQEFKFYKFRSMYADAEQRLEELLGQNEMLGPVFKMKDDPRITRIGRFLRRTSLDELPQLVNVLKGDMSIVGPRPPLPREVAQYTPYQRQRLKIVPGLTCYWQVQPRRNSLSFNEWVELDLRYIREQSYLLNWKLVFLTVKAMVRGEGE